MDAQFTQDIQDWLEQSPEERDIQRGATLLLQLNRNRILHDNIVRKGAAMGEKLEYELRKHLRIRLEGHTLQDVLRWNMTVVPHTAELIAQQETAQAQAHTEDESQGPQFHGRRPDHEQLPPEVQALWDDNAELFYKMKGLYTQLLTMDGAPICDRYELLKPLAEADTQYRQNLEKYDHFQIETPTEEEKAETADTPKPKKTTRQKATKAKA